MILTIRTDKPEAEIGLLTSNGDRLQYKTWQAHRMLAETLHEEIVAMLGLSGAVWADITGVVVYAGPGSFTGLRIGISVANALAQGLGVGVVGVSGDNWIEAGTHLLVSDRPNKSYVVPEYGLEPHITQQRK